MERSAHPGGDQWGTLISAAGAAGAAIGLVYAMGSLVLGFRYQGFDLPGQAVTVTPREQLLIRGGVAMALWTALGVLLVLALELLSRRLPEASRSHGVRRAVVIGVVALALTLFLLLEVWWPLLALGAVVIAAVSLRWRSRPVLRFLVCALAVGAVAATYESDRLRFIVERTCVEYTDQDGSVCGILVGQTDRGIYVGRLPSQGRSTELVFVPASRVLRATTLRREAKVVASEARARREPIRSRLLGLNIR